MNSGDLKVLVVAGAIFLGSLVCAGQILRLLRLKPTSLLSPREWRIFAKLVATAICALVLLLRLINSELAASMFIYGRF